MKLYSNNLAQLLNLISSGKIKALLLHGPNYGLSNIILDSISKKFDFMKTSISLKHDSLATLEQRAYMKNFFGQKEMIRVNDFPSSINKNLKELLEQDDFGNFICFIAQDSLPPSGLRKFFEQSNNLATIGCYHDDASTTHNIILKKINSLGKHINEDALSYITTHLTGDRMLIANELKKIIMYCTNKNTITLSDVTACISGQLLASGDDMCFYFASGQYDLFLIEMQTLHEQNINEILMIRALQRFYINLYIVLSYQEDGMALDMAIKKLSPPLFFKLIPKFKAIVNKTSSHDAVTMIKKLCNAEIEYKTNNHAFDLFMFLTRV